MVGAETDIGGFRPRAHPPAMRAAQIGTPCRQRQGILKWRASCPDGAETLRFANGLQDPPRCPPRCPRALRGILSRAGASGGIWLRAREIAQANQGRDPDAPRCPGAPGEGIWEVSEDETAMRAAQSSIRPSPRPTSLAKRPGSGAAVRLTHPKMPSLPKVSCPRRASMATGRPSAQRTPSGIIESPVRQQLTPAGAPHASKDALAAKGVLPSQGIYGGRHSRVAPAPRNDHR